MPTYIRLTDYKSSDEKERGFFDPKNRYEAKQEDFEKIPGSPIAYWVSKGIKNTFLNKLLYDYSISDGQNVTSNNDRFIKLHWEVNSSDIIQNNLNYQKYIFYAKGGEYKSWYGNIEYVIDWSTDAHNFHKKNKNSRIIPKYLWFKKAITWSLLTSSNKDAFRVLDRNATFDKVGSSIFIKDDKNYTFILGLLNSAVVDNLLKILNGTIALQVKDVRNIPIIFPKSSETKQKIDQLTQQNIDISKEEWDSRETSWDFRINELIRMKNEKLKVKNCKIEDAYNAYCDYWREKFFQLHANEEELNRLFIDIYGLQEELTPDVPLEDITILKNEAKIVDGELVFQADEIMKQLISYGVGVMFGRYSLDREGLQIANLGDDALASQMMDETEVSFPIDDDNIIPVLEDDYFTDDMASRFVQFVKAAFGEEHLSENIKFIEDALGTNLRKYFVKGFYEDHIKRYKKRPIYWMVASPKKGFMALLYMHRYKSDIFARVRNSYLTEYIAKLEAHKETLRLTTTSETASNKDKKDAAKKIKAIETKLSELIEFDREKMMHASQNPVDIDLDDGVKVNYCRFRDILYPITGLCKK